MSTKPKVRIISPPSSPELEDVREEDDEVLPMHHQVLYDLLGEDKAESILNPKMEEQPTRRQSIHPNGQRIILLPSIDTGMGAEAIWKTLKEKSDKKINRLEERIPDEWKQAYSAFLRDRLAQDKPLPFRSFTAKADVPDLEILKQHDYVYKVRKIRNHTNVMYRSSESNLNHTTLLLNNNPLPECKRSGKNVALDRYFDDRFLQQRPESADVKSIEYLEPTAGLPQPRNLHFLTNEGAKCKGTFYAKYADEENMKMVTDVPGYEVKLPPSMSARYSISAPGNAAAMKKEWKRFERKVATHKTSRWEPLTIGSLLEYSTSKSIPGSGDFRRGAASRWKNTASAGI
uniref:testis-specific gene 13 protein-like n=1 Tax=Styela clava TaxID=7725 RepID=UPI0019399679|nr:testis-specific gene 13 protein-like [Styela clava]